MNDIAGAVLAYQPVNRHVLSDSIVRNEERKRRILIIAPSNLRKQWHQELSEKFFLPCAILESKSYNQAIKGNNFRPLDLDGTVVICSYQFARSKAADVHATPWDLVVIDEARPTLRDDKAGLDRLSQPNLIGQQRSLGQRRGKGEQRGVHLMRIEIDLCAGNRAGHALGAVRRIRRVRS